MLLPEAPSEELVVSEPRPVVLLRSARASLDKALVDRALTSRILEDIDAFYDRLRSVALDPDDPQSVQTLRYLIDRAAGKPKEAVSLSTEDGSPLVFSWVAPTSMTPMTTATTTPTTPTTEVVEGVDTP